MSICVIACGSALCENCTKYVVSYKTQEGGLRCAMELNDLCGECFDSIRNSSYMGLLDKLDNPAAYGQVCTVSPWLRALTWRRRWRTTKHVAWWCFIWLTWILFFVMTVKVFKGEVKFP